MVNFPQLQDRGWDVHLVVLDEIKHPKFGHNAEECYPWQKSKNLRSQFIDISGLITIHSYFK